MRRRGDVPLETAGASRTGVPHFNFETMCPTVTGGVPAGLTAVHCAGRGRSDPALGARGGDDASVAAADCGRQRRVSAELASARALTRRSLAATSLFTVSFFWMAAFARLSSDVAIRSACSALVAAWLAKARSPAVMCVMSRDSAKAAVQCVFQLFQVWSTSG
jgi:hypothetical protein